MQCWFPNLSCCIEDYNDLSQQNTYFLPYFPQKNSCNGFCNHVLCVIFCALCVS